VPDFTGSFSGSFEGNGSGLTNVDYYNLANLPTTITPFQKNSILANNSVRDNFVSNVKTRLNAEGVISSSAQLTTEFDARYGNETGDNLVSGSAQVKSLLPSGTISGSTQVVSSLPNGLISSSAQITELDSLTVNSDATVDGDLHVKQYIKHKGDGNTFINFTENRIRFQAGGKTFLGLNEEDGAPFTVMVNNGGNNIDFVVKDNDNQILLQTDADADNVLFPAAVKISGSAESTASFGTYIGDGSQLTGITSVPPGTISSSAQITALGFSTTDNTGSDSQTLSLVGQTLSISSGNSVSLAGIAGGGGSGGSSIWNTGSQDPGSYTKLLTQNNLEVTGSVDIKGDFTVNGQSVFTQTSASDAGNALIVKGRLKVLEEQIGNYIASASIQVGNTQDTIDCGGFF